jgi:hypothetical protein
MKTFLSEETDSENNLRRLADCVTGLGVRSARAAKILALEDWAQYYPVATRKNGVYTGKICGSQDDGFTMHDDLYCVED